MQPTMGPTFERGFSCINPCCKDYSNEVLSNKPKYFMTVFLISVFLSTVGYTLFECASEPCVGLHPGFVAIPKIEVQHRLDDLQPGGIP